MNTKFEPGQLVLMKIGDCHKWSLCHFSHIRDGQNPYVAMNRGSYRYCVPFNEETKHLQNTSQPYEPQADEATRFECGEWVEVTPYGVWQRALYLKYEDKDNPMSPHHVFVFGTYWNASPRLIRKVKP